MSEQPICDDLYCGLGGWADGFLAEGYRVRGYDIEAHDYGTGGYPGELIIRDVRSMHGSELKDATVIVGSSPCQEFSYRGGPKVTSSPYPQSWTRVSGEQEKMLLRSGHIVYQRGDGPHHWTAICDQCRKDAEDEHNKQAPQKL